MAKSGKGCFNSNSRYKETGKQEAFKQDSKSKHDGKMPRSERGK